jgi:DNA polymerase-3 subunit epsilon
VKGIPSCGLDSLQHWFGLENFARHRAAGDAVVTAELLARLLRLAREEGARTLQDLEAVQTRRVARRRRRRSVLPPELPGEPGAVAI